MCQFVRQHAEGPSVRRLGSLTLLVVVLIAVLPGVVTAQDQAEGQDIYSPRTLQIARTLLCPVCAGETVADSNSELARQMRDEIEQQVQAGISNEEITAYFVERYGKTILADPPKSGFELSLWWMPVLAVSIGALVVGLYLRERTGGSAATPAMGADDAELEQIARDILASSGAGETSRGS